MHACSNSYLHYPRSHTNYKQTISDVLKIGVICHISFKFYKPYNQVWDRPTDAMQVSAAGRVAARRGQVEHTSAPRAAIIVDERTRLPHSSLLHIQHLLPELGHLLPGFWSQYIFGYAVSRWIAWKFVLVPSLGITKIRFSKEIREGMTIILASQFISHWEWNPLGTN